MPTPAAMRQRRHRARQIEADAEGFRARRAAAARARRARRTAERARAAASGVLGEVFQEFVRPLLAPEARAQEAEKKAAEAEKKAAEAEAEAAELAARLACLTQAAEEVQELAHEAHAQGRFWDAAGNNVAMWIRNVLASGLDDGDGWESPSDDSNAGGAVAPPLL